MKLISTLSNLAITVILVGALVPELGFAKQATVDFKSTPTHFRYRNGMQWGGMDSFGTSYQEFQAAIVTVGPPSGPLPTTYDFDAPCDPRALGDEADEPKAPTVNLPVLSSSSPTSDSYKVPLSTLMRISDEDPLTPGTRLLLLYKPVAGGSNNQIIVWDAFKTSQSSLPGGTDHFEVLHLALAQALDHASVMEGCSILELLHLDITPKPPEDSKGQVTPVVQAMIKAAASAPAYLSFGIYFNLQDYVIPGTYEPMVRSFLALTKDPDAGQYLGPERQMYGDIALGFQFHAINAMYQTGNFILPNTDLWESSVVNGTNVIAVRDVLKQFSQFALVGSKQNENKMLGLLDSPDFETRLFAAFHFAYISDSSDETASLSNIEMASQIRPTAENSYDTILKKLASVIASLKPKARGLIASGKIPVETQAMRRVYQYFN